MTYSLRIKMSPKMVEAFVDAIEAGAEPPRGLTELLKPGEFVGFEQLEWLHKHSSTAGVFHQVMAGSEIVLPSPEVQPRNPVLEARIQKLKAAQEEREYKKMTKNVDSVRYRHPEDSIASQMKQINRQLIAVLQFVFSVIAGFVFGFIGIELIVGDLEFGFRLLLGVICALVIALAEIYFLAKKLAEEMEDETPVHKPKKD